MKRVILFALIGLLTQASVAWPCGMNTHAEVSVRARWFFNGETHPDWKQWLNSHQDALQAGSTFPDWGYAFGYGNESEDAPLGSCDILIKTRFEFVAMTDAFQCVDGNWDDVVDDDESDTITSYRPAAVGDEDEDDEGGCGC